MDNLKEGTLYWLDTLPDPPVYPKLEEDIECEVLVIGGGESGALISYALREQGVDAVVVDQRDISHGSTCANTGLLQFQNDKSLTGFIHTFGEEKAVRMYKLCEQAVIELDRITSTLDIDPQFARRDSLYYASCPEDLPKLKEEYNNLKKHGFNVEFWDEAKIRSKYSFGKAGAIYSIGDAEINPYRNAVSVLHTLHNKGMRIYQHTEIQRHAAEKDHIVFYTADGRSIKAQKAVIASGYETQKFKTNPNAVLTSSYALVTQPFDSFPGWHERTLIWETARPYLYVRTTKDNRIIIGGRDENTVIPEERERMLKQKTKLLLEDGEKLFPELGPLRADYAWGATFGSTHDGLPMFGEQDGFPHCYFALGYGGNGTVASTIASKVITELIVRGSSPDAELFRFDRPSKSQ
ncbi:NAD(P)/FAD-dependent oxidoreductase [Paenibacillus gansuensis]|uniref:NAD(P)/FAD-dependent oxidoreductase n=1 Tax=Paenibacillus gansuensis TaxID=306542 RepID=A0ABW5PIF4_9BACL